VAQNLLGPVCPVPLTVRGSPDGVAQFICDDAVMAQRHAAEARAWGPAPVSLEDAEAAEAEAESHEHEEDDLPSDLAASISADAAHHDLPADLAASIAADAAHHDPPTDDVRRLGHVQRSAELPSERPGVRGRRRLHGHALQDAVRTTVTRNPPRLCSHFHPHPT